MDDNYELKDHCHVLTMSTLRLEGNLNVELQVCIRQCWKDHERSWCLGKIWHYTSHYQYSWYIHLHVPVLSCAHIHPRILCSNVWDSQHSLQTNSLNSKIHGVFKKRPNILNSMPTGTGSALRLLSAPSGRF